MKATEVVKAIMKKQGVGTNRMADRLNRPPRLVSDRLSQSNISIDKLNEMLRLLDYKIVIIPREARLPADSFEVE